jgi:hypothetical protein
MREEAAPLSSSKPTVLRVLHDALLKSVYFSQYSSLTTVWSDVPMLLCFLGRLLEKVEHGKCITCQIR